MNPQAADGGFQVYWRDMQSGSLRSVTLNPDGAGAGAVDSTAPALSSDGRFVLFSSRGRGFVPGDLNNAYDAFIRDTTTSAIELISRAATNLSAVTANADSLTRANALSADGRYVVFESSADNLVVATPTACAMCSCAISNWARTYW